jgi:hypothetical protein
MKRLLAPATLAAAFLVALSAFLGGGPYWPI